MSYWWRVSCEELGDEAAESVLAPTAEHAAVAWAEGRGTDADAVLLVEVTGEMGNTGVLVGDAFRFELRARVLWLPRRIR